MTEVRKVEAFGIAAGTGNSARNVLWLYNLVIQEHKKPLITRSSSERRHFHSLRWAVLMCAIAILLVETLQATHIHREWNAPSGPNSTVRIENGQDAQCVFCLSSHAAHGLPLYASFAHFQSSTVNVTSEITALHLDTAVRDYTIRPPPIA